MLQWLMANWGKLLIAVVLGGYYCVYVLAIRHQRSRDPNQPKLPCDRC